MTNELKKDLYVLLKKVYVKGELNEVEVVKLIVLAQEFIDSESHNYPDRIEEVSNIKKYFEKRLKQSKSQLQDAIEFATQMVQKEKQNK